MRLQHLNFFCQECIPLLWVVEVGENNKHCGEAIFDADWMWLSCFLVVRVARSHSCTFHWSCLLDVNLSQEASLKVWADANMLWDDAYASLPVLLVENFKSIKNSSDTASRQDQGICPKETWVMFFRSFFIQVLAQSHAVWLLNHGVNEVVGRYPAMAVEFVEADIAISTSGFVKPV